VDGAYIFGKTSHTARNSWIYIDGEVFNGARVDIGDDPKEPWVHIAWKYLVDILILIIALRAYL
jgi:arylsulfatase